MFKKLNKKGFTLAELLIVVAIIGVLVAISIPIFTSQLEKSREATDMANLRAAKAAVVTAILTDSPKAGSAEASLLGGTKVYYDAQNGVLTTAKPNGYLQGTAAKNNDLYTDSNNEYKYVSATAYTGKVLGITYDATNEEITYSFE
jgi:type IV pilus assembly protein PilA